MGGCCGITKHDCDNLMFGKRGKLLFEKKRYFIFGLRLLVFFPLMFTGKLILFVDRALVFFFKYFIKALILKSFFCVRK